MLIDNKSLMLSITTPNFGILSFYPLRRQNSYIFGVSISPPRGARFDLAERTVEWTVDPLNLIQTMLAEGFRMSNVSTNVKVLAEGTVIIALSVILKDIFPPIYHLPQGGSVSLAGMVPLIWFALRRGLRAGIEVGAVFGLVHMALGGYIVDPVQAIIGYPLAFGALGLAGLFRKYPLVGVAVGISGRFLAHFVEGVWFFWICAPEGMNPLVYSAIYNGSYYLWNS
jgi:thiamine transporter